ncbi:hypothetical protein N431DRAFT_19708 [Stipitochalara longipes BDJ]|nr:hypothetical protein N431DRAFT_19708 [Stipitochalara longipes BDJ]
MEQWSSGRCMPNTVPGAPTGVGGPVLVRCAADREPLAQPACSQTGRAGVHQYSLNISRTSKCKCKCKCKCRCKYQSSPWWTGGCCTTNHGRRRCSKRSTTWIFLTGVSGHAHIRGGACSGQGLGAPLRQAISATLPKMQQHQQHEHEHEHQTPLARRSPHGEILQKPLVLIPEALHFTAAVRWLR